MLTKAEIDELLERREGRDLDFKEGQYPFAGADDSAKSELLKDILAFANTPRMHDAYILVGVREVKDGKSIPIGVADHLDDASLQQFVNSKTNRKVVFAYETMPYDGISLGVIRIDRSQARPIWATKRFGKVEVHQVFIRSGSSTAIASPDDIANMAEAPATRRPDLSLAIYSPDTEGCTKAATASRTYYRMPPMSEIRDYETYIEGPMGMRLMSAGGDNRDYYRDSAEYIAQRQLVVPIRLCIDNSGAGSANDVLVTLRFNSGASSLSVLSADDLVAKPHRNMLYGMASRSIRSSAQSLSIKKSDLGWSATFAVKKILARQRFVFAETLYVQSASTDEIGVDVSILADELSEPLSDHVSISIEVDEVEVATKKLYAFLDGRGAGNSDD